MSMPSVTPVEVMQKVYLKTIHVRQKQQPESRGFLNYCEAQHLIKELKKCISNLKFQATKRINFLYTDTFFFNEIKNKKP